METTDWDLHTKRILKLVLVRRLNINHCYLQYPCWALQLIFQIFPIAILLQTTLKKHFKIGFAT